MAKIKNETEYTKALHTLYGDIYVEDCERECLEDAIAVYEVETGIDVSTDV